jgi:hypothetical protein
VVAIVFVILLVAMLLLFHAPDRTAAASSKAQELIAAFERAGLTAPSEDQIVGTFGEDGGAVCAADFGDLIKGNLNLLLANGAAQVGQRAIIVDPKVLKGEVLIRAVYCPDRLPAFEEFVAKLKTARLIGD